MATADSQLLPLEGIGVSMLSEVPCRVSSDLHERRNDRSTVSTTDPVKL